MLHVFCFKFGRGNPVASAIRHVFCHVFWFGEMIRFGKRKSVRLMI